MGCLWSIVTSTSLATSTSKYSKASLSGISGGGSKFKESQTHLFSSPSRYLIDKLGEENEEEKRVYRDFLRRNAASARKNAMCNPSTTSSISNMSNSCHIVYMDGSPSYPASGAHTHTMFEEVAKLNDCHQLLRKVV